MERKKEKLFYTKEKRLWNGKEKAVWKACVYEKEKRTKEVKSTCYQATERIGHTSVLSHKDKEGQVD